MSRRSRWITAALLAVALTCAGAAITAATAGDTERPITGAAYAKATRAALAHTGGGRVTGTEAGDEDSHYEVEVTLSDGSQVDVQLDRGFGVVGSKTDHESPNDRDGTGR
ncbi:hypothetical protein ACGFNU_16435 [Spirillospora sp. NPDC048911]|uniref:PepSY domain-containing protein n=1 Tax=Spirillospora sp. NPDC048911 TaxID=3364527 RepID=UPI00371E4F22